ncbi:MAG: conserved rane protein of unknown function [Candidatus Saccharibacteria bacterium]|nr:conserved rane protein of unknown function [Candidatus Saccharibacteria bacterium]
MKKSLFAGAAIAVLMVTISLVVVNTASAQFNMGMSDGANAARGVNQVADLFGEQGTFRTLTNVMLFLVGAISVIMLIIGGMRYVVSGGDSSAVTGAKNTILYAIVGIIVAILAYAAVSFVISSLSGSSVGTSV